MPPPDDAYPTGSLEGNGFRSRNFVTSPLRAWGPDETLCVGDEGVLIGHWQPAARTHTGFFETFGPVKAGGNGNGVVRGDAKTEELFLDPALSAGMREWQRLLWAAGEKGSPQKANGTVPSKGELSSVEGKSLVTREQAAYHPQSHRFFSKCFATHALLGGTSSCYALYDGLG